VVQPEDRSFLPSPWSPPQQSPSKRRSLSHIRTSKRKSLGHAGLHRSDPRLREFWISLQGRFVIPDFSTFTEETQKLWAVSICTVDGQRSVPAGPQHWSGPVCLGDASWPLLYGVSVELLGSNLVHRYVGLEEYSRHESPFSLTRTGVPHSPLTETGAIVVSSLLQVTSIHPSIHPSILSVMTS
uniref:glutaminase n=1 Tax=Cynoglossus semilaevis TaxID=244447 RepID=A0A3P8X7B7_CYNSE